MKIFINDTVRRNARLYEDHRRRKFSLQIAQFSFVVFMAPFVRLTIFSGPFSQPKIFGGRSKYLPATYPELLMIGPLDEAILC